MRRQAPAPWHFGILNLSHGVVSGGVSGTLLAYMLRQQGVTPHHIANESSLLILPGSLFFLWSPITDFLLRRRTWLLISSTLASVAVMLALQMNSYASRSAVMLLLLATCLIFVAAAAVGGLVASLMRPDQRPAWVAFCRRAIWVAGLWAAACYCCWRPTSASSPWGWPLPPWS
jgi:MFS transporter, PAT family, beta-lactamase induction signal transducer AmpG